MTTTWATTEYTRQHRLSTRDYPDGCHWERQDGSLTDCDGSCPLAQTMRDLTPAELPLAVYAVEASDDKGRTYASNGLRWTDPEPARIWAHDLVMRWFGCTNVRVVRVTPPTQDGNAYTVEAVIDQTL